MRGRFFGIDADGDEPSVSVRRRVAQLVERGHDRVISTECEGLHWSSRDDAFPVVAAEQVLQRAAALDAGSAMVTDADQARRQLAEHLGRRPAAR